MFQAQGSDPPAPRVVEVRSDPADGALRRSRNWGCPETGWQMLDKINRDPGVGLPAQRSVTRRFGVGGISDHSFESSLRSGCVRSVTSDLSISRDVGVAEVVTHPDLAAGRIGKLVAAERFMEGARLTRITRWKNGR